MTGSQLAHELAREVSRFAAVPTLSRAAVHDELAILVRVFLARLLALASAADPAVGGPVRYEGAVSRALRAAAEELRIVQCELSRVSLLGLVATCSECGEAGGLQWSRDRGAVMLPHYAAAAVVYCRGTRAGTIAGGRDADVVIALTAVARALVELEAVRAVDQW